MRAHWTQLAEKGRSAVEYEDLLPSPCSSVCRIDEQGFCEGCLRNLDEIRAWSVNSDEDKRLIWRHILVRIDSRLSST